MAPIISETEELFRSSEIMSKWASNNSGVAMVGRLEDGASGVPVPQAAAGTFPEAYANLGLSGLFEVIWYMLSLKTYR